MKTRLACLILASLAVVAVSCDSEEPQGELPAKPPTEMATEPQADTQPTKPLYAFELNDIEGKPVKLGQYSGKALLLVNVASKCGYTRQYAGLQALYEKYQGDGLVVLGFPANNFGAQEPDTNDQIKAFCTTTFNITFPMFAKISVKGDDIHPLYAFLTDTEMNPNFAGEIKWNFNKFLINRTGEIVGRYDSNVEPMSEALVMDVEKALQPG